jgi:23S rRNA (uracil1939-C5)-methyltransferase
MAFGGDATGRHEGLVFFVPFGIVGEEIEAEIEEIKKSYGRARITSIISPSPQRVSPPCPLFGQCGGCQLQHIHYEQQLEFKREIVYDLLTRLGKFENPPVKETLSPSSPPWHYRNKVQAVVGRGEQKCSPALLGLYRRNSHLLVPLDNCPIQHPLNNRVITAAAGLLEKYRWPPYQEHDHSGTLRHLICRVSSSRNQVMVTLVTKEKRLRGVLDFARELKKEVPEIAGFHLNYNPARTNVIAGKESQLVEGSERLREELEGCIFSLSPLSFFQVNIEGLRALYRLIDHYADLRGNETVIDGYCGAAIFALLLSKKAGKIYGVEEVHAAVTDGLENIRLNRAENIEIFQGKAEEIITELFRERKSCQVLLVDPPRSGVNRELLESVIAHRIRRVIYVSCNPSTFARDARILAEGGYVLKEAQPLDMFPQTSQIEIVSYMDYVGGW